MSIQREESLKVRQHSLTFIFVLSEIGDLQSADTFIAFFTLDQNIDEWKTSDCHFSGIESFVVNTDHIEDAKIPPKGDVGTWQKFVNNSLCAEEVFKNNPLELTSKWGPATKTSKQINVRNKSLRIAVTCLEVALKEGN